MYPDEIFQNCQTRCRSLFFIRVADRSALYNLKLDRNWDVQLERMGQLQPGDNPNRRLSLAASRDASYYDTLNTQTVRAGTYVDVDLRRPLLSCPSRLNIPIEFSL